MITQYRWDGPMLAASPWGTLREAIAVLSRRGGGDIEARCVAGCRTCGETRTAMRNGRCGEAPGSVHAWDDSPTEQAARAWPVHAVVDPHPNTGVEGCLLTPWEDAAQARLSFQSFANDGTSLPSLNMRFHTTAAEARVDAESRVSRGWWRS